MSKDKDPAFLFYSKDFYEGTRMMLPEERACYIDLLIYQHQNGIIPLDLKRLLLYCSGVDEATLKATLKAKFKETSEGWLNNRLEIEISNRSNFKKEQSLSGKIGQFWKKAYQILSKKDILILKKNISKDQIINILNKIDITDEETLKGSLKHCLSIYANEDANEDANVNENKDVIKKGGMGEKIVFPFNSENFISQWNLWKDYKSKEHKFHFKTAQSEQAQLSELNNLSKGNEEIAIAIMHQSMANGWKGFFELKTNLKNGKQTAAENAGQYSNDFIAKHLANLQP